MTERLLSAALYYKAGDYSVMSTVVITGGSRGIGAAAVKLFADRGDKVYFLYEKNYDAAQKVAKETGATAICCDVADGKAVASAFKSIADVDILICNAGIGHYQLMSQLSEEDWDRVFAVNVKGMYHCINQATPHFLKKHKGSIITVSSMWGQYGASCEVAYSATKGAVIAMTKALAQELGPSGIRVNCVAPGVVLTDMCDGVSEETLQSLAGESLVGRNGTPEDIAKAFAYLADADFVTGQVLGVNGGFVL